MLLRSSLTLTLSLLFFISFSQCFDHDGIGTFEGNNALSDWFIGTEGYATYGITSTEKNSGDNSLMFDVTQAGPWQVRMILQECKFDIIDGNMHSVGIYVKGDPGMSVKIDFRNGSSTMDSKTIVLSTNDWEFHGLEMESNATSDQGGFRIVFLSTGTYYIDDLTVDAVDCAGVLGGSASVDACGLCSGGTTGISPNLTCNLINTDITSDKIVWEGVVDQIISPSRIINYRFEESYATTRISGYKNSSRATSSVGMVLRFKTSSPSVKVTWDRNTTHASSNSNQEIAVYKDGIPNLLTTDLEINLTNATGQSTEWKMILPVYSQLDLLSIQLIENYDLEEIVEAPKPVYVAIGNSITMGVGSTNNAGYTTYPSLISEHYGYHLYNWGIGGSKIYEPVLDNFDFIETPTVITVLWGYNDIDASGSDSFFNTSTMPRWELLLEGLCSMFPQTKILVILPIHSDTFHASSVRNLDNLSLRQREVVEDLQLTYNNICFIDGEDFISSTGQLTDGVHPNNGGYEALANGIIAKLDATNDNCYELITSSEKEIVDSQKQVYPNPTTSAVLLPEGEPYEVYNALGTIMFKGNGAQVDLSALPQGIYFIHGTSQVWRVQKQ